MIQWIALKSKTQWNDIRNFRNLLEQTERNRNIRKCQMKLWAELMFLKHLLAIASSCKHQQTVKDVKFVYATSIAIRNEMVEWIVHWNSMSFPVSVGRCQNGNCAWFPNWGRHYIYPFLWTIVDKQTQSLCGVESLQINFEVQRFPIIH